MEDDDDLPGKPAALGGGGEKSRGRPKRGSFLVRSADAAPTLNLQQLRTSLKPVLSSSAILNE